MSPPRYVVLGLAHPRAPWFADVGRWANAGLLPVDFIRCVSAEEVGAHLAVDRRFSAALVDGGHRGLDRDLIGLLHRAGAATVVVDPPGPERFSTLGATAALSTPFDPSALAEVLERWAPTIGPVVPSGAVAAPVAPPPVPPRRGRVVAVTGGSGSGTSIAAMSIAQGLAQGFGTDASLGPGVILADLALDADQAMLHHAPDVSPGLAELVEAHRRDALSPASVTSLTFIDERRGYRLLLGLRRRRDWTALRPRAIAASLVSLQEAASAVVADVDPDLDGEAECGSIDVEERNALARTAARAADLIVVTTTADAAGLHRCARVLLDLLAFGVEPRRIQPLVTRGPTSAPARARLARGVTRLIGPVHPGASGVATPLHLPSIRNVDVLVHDARPLPERTCSVLARSVAARVRSLPATDAPETDDVVPVAPGSLGHWFDDVGAAAP